MPIFKTPHDSRTSLPKEGYLSVSFSFSSAYQLKRNLFGNEVVISNYGLRKNVSKVLETKICFGICTYNYFNTISFLLHQLFYVD